jgi:probable rRNA maturation factor
VVEPVRLDIEVVKAVRVPVPPAFLRRVLQRAASVPEVAARLPAGTATVAVRLASDEELRRLNREYAGHDSVTDVLSFEGSAGRAQGALLKSHVGDLAISWPRVVRQAHEHGHTAETELGLLAVHGLLHLLGWDHVRAPERKEMNRLTRAALLLSGLTLRPGRID